MVFSFAKTLWLCDKKCDFRDLRPIERGGKDPHPQDFSLTKKTARFTKGQIRPYYGHFCGKKNTGRGLVVKRLGVLSKVQTLNLVLGVGVFSPLPNQDSQFCFSVCQPIQMKSRPKILRQRNHNRIREKNANLWHFEALWRLVLLRCQPVRRFNFPIQECKCKCDRPQLWKENALGARRPFLDTHKGHSRTLTT